MSDKKEDNLSLFDCDLLKQKMKERHISTTIVAAQMEVTWLTLNKKLRGHVKWTLNDIHAIKKILKLTKKDIMDIFF